MLLKIVMAASLLAIWPTVARATVSNEQRVPTSASIPCRGQLKEHYTEGGNIHTMFFELSLTCEDAGKIAWTLRSSAGCYVDEGMSDKDGGCSGPAMEPVSSFIKNRDDERSHAYKLVKYVFARSCDPVSIHRKKLQANTNAVRYDETVSGLLCKEVASVDGTVDDKLQPLKPGSYKYVDVKTEGGASEMEDGDDETEVLGTKAGDSNYGISWSKGVMRRED